MRASSAVDSAAFASPSAGFESFAASVDCHRREMYCGIAVLDGCLDIELKDEKDDGEICWSLGDCDRCCDAARDERSSCLLNMMYMCEEVGEE